MRGFTLIEVMAAVAVIAIALAALIQAATERSAGLVYLRERTFAQWIAANKLAEMQLQRVWTTGGQDSRRRFAGREWPVHVEIRRTPYPRLHRVDVSVYDPDDEDRRVGRLTGLLRRPRRGGAGQ